MKFVTIKRVQGVVENNLVKEKKFTFRVHTKSKDNNNKINGTTSN